MGDIEQRQILEERLPTVPSTSLPDIEEEQKRVTYQKQRQREDDIHVAMTS